MIETTSVALALPPQTKNLTVEGILQITDAQRGVLPPDELQRAISQERDASHHLAAATLLHYAGVEGSLGAHKQYVAILAEKETKLGIGQEVDQQNLSRLERLSALQPKAQVYDTIFTEVGPYADRFSDRYLHMGRVDLTKIEILHAATDGLNHAIFKTLPPVNSRPSVNPRSPDSKRATAIIRAHRIIRHALSEQFLGGLVEAFEALDA
jgi:hypothetical protein